MKEQKFNLAEMLADVSKLDTQEQIEYLSIDDIFPDPNNFYQLSGIPELMANIELIGLQQPIRVRPHPEQEGKYIIISGHRRHAACKMLAEEQERFRLLPCIVERQEESDSLRQLRLIYANANTRTMTSAEVSQQVEQVEQLLYQLKEEGYEFPGRMRDHVAEACKVSTGKIARLKVIRDNLTPAWASLYKANRLNEAMAYVLAQQTPEWQEIIYQAQVTPESVIKLLSTGHLEACIREMKFVSGLTIDGRCNSCTHQTHMVERAATVRYAWAGVNCRGCCCDCSSLATCKDCCPDAKAKKAELRSAAKQAEKEAKERAAERDAPYVSYAKKAYQRVADRLKELGTDAEAYRQSGAIPPYASVALYLPETLEGKREICRESYLPFGNMLQAESAQYLIKAADALQCSLDYLFGRSDRRCEPAAETETPLRWRSGEPPEDGRYIVVERDEYGDMIDDCRFKDGKWQLTGLGNNTTVVKWLPMPEEEA